MAEAGLSEAERAREALEEATVAALEAGVPVSDVRESVDYVIETHEREGGAEC